MFRISGACFVLLTVAHASENETTVNEADGSAAACVLIRDEGPFLTEWIDFHKQQGVGHFYLYNDIDGTDDTADLMAPYVKSGDVTLISWPPPPNSRMHMQIVKGEMMNQREPLVTCKTFRKSQSACREQAFSHCVGMIRKERKYKWAGIFNPDEFYFSPKFGSVKAMLAKKYADGYVGVGQRAKIFGTSDMHGDCKSLPPVSSTHYQRGQWGDKNVEYKTKVPWVRVDQVLIEGIRTNSHGFPNCPAHKCKWLQQSSEDFESGTSPDATMAARMGKMTMSACCEKTAHRPPVDELQLNHYQYKSHECSVETAMKSWHNHEHVLGEKARSLSKVRDDAIQAFIPEKYSWPLECCDF